MKFMFSNWKWYWWKIAGAGGGGYYLEKNQKIKES